MLAGVAAAPASLNFVGISDGGLIRELWLLIYKKELRSTGADRRKYLKQEIKI